MRLRKIKRWVLVTFLPVTLSGFTCMCFLFGVDLNFPFVPNLTVGPFTPIYCPGVECYVHSRNLTCQTETWSQFKHGVWTKYQEHDMGASLLFMYFMASVLLSLGVIDELIHMNQ